MFLISIKFIAAKNEFITSLNFIKNDKFIVYGNRNGEIILQEIDNPKNSKKYYVNKFESILEPPSEMYINPKNTVW